MVSKYPQKTDPKSQYANRDFPIQGGGARDTTSQLPYAL